MDPLRAALSPVPGRLPATRSDAPPTGEVRDAFVPGTSEAPGLLPRPASAKPSGPAPGEPDTFVFVLNSAGETNLALPLIQEVRKRGYQVKVIHFRHNSKDILTSRGVLGEEDFLDGTNRFYLPRVGSIFKHDLDPSRVARLVATPHHAFSQFAFAEAREHGIPTVAAVDLGVPGTEFRFRHTFYRALSMADQTVVPDETVRQRLLANLAEVEKESGYHVDPASISLGGNPGFESFRLEVEGHRAHADELRARFGILPGDLVVSFSSQPTPRNGEVLETVGRALREVAAGHPGRRIHLLLAPHPRDLYRVGLKNLFGTETSLSIFEKLDLVRRHVADLPQVQVHDAGPYAMKEVAALSRVILTESSTTAYEAAHSEIPSIFVRAPGQGLGTTFPGYTRIPAVADPSALAREIETAAATPPAHLARDLAAVVNTSLEPYLTLLLPPPPPPYQHTIKLSPPPYQHTIKL